MAIAHATKSHTEMGVVRLSDRTSWSAAVPLDDDIVRARRGARTDGVLGVPSGSAYESWCQRPELPWIYRYTMSGDPYSTIILTKSWLDRNPAACPMSAFLPAPPPFPPKRRLQHCSPV